MHRHFEAKLALQVTTYALRMFKTTPPISTKVCTTIN